MRASALRFIRAILPGKHPRLWSKSIFGKEYAGFLKSIRQEDAVIFWAIGNLKDIKMITEDSSTHAFSSLLWDPLRQVCHFSQREINRYPDIMKKLGVRVCSFDKVDSDTYGLDYVGQVYRYPDSQSPDTGNSQASGEVLFIGVDKQRADKLNRLAAQLEKEGVGYDFRIIFDRHSKPGRFPRLDACRLLNPIPYSKVLQLSLRTNCLLDILQPGQNGLTMRALEALFFGKKLITDNIRIKEEPFYNASNIYVIDDPDQKWPDLRSFLDAPSEKIPSEIIQAYDITSRIRNLIPFADSRSFY